MEQRSLLDTISLEPDPVIEFYKQGLDLTLLRANLRLSYAERWQRLEELYRFAQQLRTAEVRRPPRDDDAAGATQDPE